MSEKYNVSLGELRSGRRSSYSYSYGDAAKAYFLSDVPDKLVEELWQYEMNLDDDDDFSDYSVV
ncbi:MAG: hypothetical protein V3U02_01270 [Calditrichia bacterium]